MFLKYAADRRYLEEQRDDISTFNSDQNHSETSPHLDLGAKVMITGDHRCWRGGGEAEPGAATGRKTAQPLCRRARRVLERSELPDPATPLLGLCPRGLKTHVHTKHAHVLTAARLTKAHCVSNAKCPTTGECTRRTPTAHARVHRQTCPPRMRTPLRCIHRARAQITVSTTHAHVPQVHSPCTRTHTDGRVHRACAHPSGAFTAHAHVHR